MPLDPVLVLDTSEWFRKASIDLRSAEVDFAATPPILERAMPLTWYAWKFRYPGSPEEPTSEEARDARDVACEAVAALLTRLPDEIRA